jgi:hypothetical protein
MHERRSNERVEWWIHMYDDSHRPASSAHRLAVREPFGLATHKPSPRRLTSRMSWICC